MKKIRFPETAKGWTTLFWITFRTCPTCKHKLLRDWGVYGGEGLWCLNCGGKHYPEGFWQALNWNYNSYEGTEEEGLSDNLPLILYLLLIVVGIIFCYWMKVQK